MRYRNSRLICRDCSSEHGVRITLNKRSRTRKCLEHFRDTTNHESDLFRCRMRANVNVRNRFWKIQFLKKNTVQLMRIMLPRMNNANRDASALRFQDHWCTFDEFRTRPQDHSKHNDYAYVLTNREI